MKIFSIILLLFLTSCYTTNKAKKQVSKAHALKPEVTAEMCSSFYPIKDSISYKFEFIQGKKDTITEYDTLINKEDSLVYVTVFRNIYKTDTIREETNKTKESKAKDLIISNLKQDNTKLEANYQTIKSNRNSWRLWFFVLVAIYLGKVFVTKKIL